MAHSEQLKVLAPDDLGLEALDTPANIAAVFYTPGDPWPAGHHDATVVVVGYDLPPPSGPGSPTYRACGWCRPSTPGTSSGSPSSPPV